MYKRNIKYLKSNGQQFLTSGAPAIAHSPRPHPSGCGLFGAIRFIMMG